GERGVADRHPANQPQIRTVAAKQSRRYYNGDVDPPDAGDEETSVQQTSGARRDGRAGDDFEMGLTTSGVPASDNRKTGSARTTAKTAKTDKPANPTADSFQAEIDSIDLALSSLVVEEPPVGKFDASGRLINVVSQRPNAPPYAVVNADRVVVAFVTPAPGVNLRPFMGRQVGVSGQRGFIPELNKAHITASRITPLDQAPAAIAV